MNRARLVTMDDGKKVWMVRLTLGGHQVFHHYPSRKPMIAEWRMKLRNIQIPTALKTHEEMYGPTQSWYGNSSRADMWYVEHITAHDNKPSHLMLLSIAKGYIRPRAWFYRLPEMFQKDIMKMAAARGVRFSYSRYDAKRARENAEFWSPSSIWRE